MKPCLFICLVLMHPFFGYAQDLNFPGTAPSLSFTAVINKKIDANLLAATKIRLGNHVVKDVYYRQQLLEIYSQALLNYKLNKYWQVSAGFGFQRNNPFEGNWRNEHRLVQQVLLVVPLQKSKFINRFRFEERWFSFPDASASFGTRARYQLGYVKQLKGSMVYWQVNNEVYAITSGSRNAFVSENWLYTGIGFGTGRFGHFETGAGYNSVIRNSRKEWSSLILLQLAWSYVVPVKHKKEMHPAVHSRHF
jgi:hypothetical protein